jgi:hypothetical protein
MRKFVKTLILFGLLLLLVAPLVAIFMLSKAEVKQYEPQSVPPLVEKAYGQIYPVKRMDISETIAFSGTFVSTKKFFMELPRLKNPYSTRMLVELGDEIYEGQLIGYSEDLKTEIRATASGIVQNINLGSASYITLESTDDVALDCHVDDTTLAVLRREGLALTTQEGEEVKILSVSKTQDEQGKTAVLLSVPNGIYGQKVEDLRLQTGRVFYQTLVVDSGCLFHLNGDVKTWYVRTVDANGNYLEDIKVEVSYTSGDYVAISGVPEGTLCDSGYGKIVEES